MKTTRTRKNDVAVEVRAEEYFEPYFSKCYDHVMDLYGYRLGFRDFCVYQTLRRFAERKGKRKGRCTVLHGTIGKIWGAHPDTVRRAIRRLRAFGLVKAFKKQGASEYFLPLIPVPKSKRRPGKNARSDQANLPYETVQDCTTYQRFYTRGSLPRGAQRPESPQNPSSPQIQRGTRLSPAERATIDYKAVRRELDAIERASQGRNLPWEEVLNTALHRAGVTKARWREIEEQFK